MEGAVNCLVGPVWRMWIPEGSDQLHLLFLPSDDDRSFSRGLAQMIDPMRLVKIHFSGHEWNVVAAKEVYLPYQNHEFAGHAMLSFTVQPGLYDRVVDTPLGWEFMNAPLGLKLERVDGVVFEPFVSTMEEFLGCPEIPTCVQAVSNG